MTYVFFLRLGRYGGEVRIKVMTFWGTLFALGTVGLGLWLANGVLFSAGLALFAITWALD